MVDDQQALRNVNWNEVFSFTHIFKSFKMAIHPSKLLLCLAALVLMFATGVVLDRIWSTWGGYAIPGEIGRHATNAPQIFHTEKQAWFDGQRDAAAQVLSDARTQYKTLNLYIAAAFLTVDPSGYLESAFRAERVKRSEGLEEGNKAAIKKNDENADAYDFLGMAEDKFADEAAKIADILYLSRRSAKKAIKDKDALGTKGKEKEYEKLRKTHANALMQLSIRKRNQALEVATVRGERISEAFLNYQWLCIHRAVAAVYYGNITSGLAEHQRTSRSDIRPITAPGSAAAGLRDVGLAGKPTGEPAGFFVWVTMSYRGVAWLIKEHWVYAAIYLLVALCVCALFGGAVSRIAALHFARDEKISIRHALRFSCGKFFSFFSAPLIPILIILVLGLFILGGALLMNIPWIGEIIVGALLFLAIMLGLAIAFLVVGFVTGGALMYPTIAAEGSDSFDGISRSFSYVFARPWRAAFYGLVALFYGVVTYLFVRLFAFIALAATHYFCGAGVWASGGELAPSADKLDLLWTAPTFDSLFGRFSWDAMSSMQSVGAFIMGIWVFLVATLVLAYLCSYWVSATTVIYFLLRRKVDATDLDDVYLEETEEEPIFSPEEESTDEPKAEGDDAGEQAPEDKADQPAEDEKPSKE